MSDKTFTLFWLTGQREVIKGQNIADAMTLSGYSNGALRALDFWASGDNEEYQWNAAERCWEKDFGRQALSPRSGGALFILIVASRHLLGSSH